MLQMSASHLLMYYNTSHAAMYTLLSTPLTNCTVNYQFRLNMCNVIEFTPQMNFNCVTHLGFQFVQSISNII